ILSADTASEVRQLLSQKRRQYFVYWRAFWQRRCCAAAAGAVLKPSGENCAVLSLVIFDQNDQKKPHYFPLFPLTLCKKYVIIITT
ncbi:hypothetical protein, partial [Gemmiger sp.]|uniref:hypothetical protein n=1 Tax=Gemmiger sp. TaxID=2049027 RepID=UPI002A753F7A